MAENSAIEWTDHTFNPWEGCQKVGPGCDNCYAEARNARFGGGVAPNWGVGAPRRRTSPTNWSKPLRWNADAADFAAKHGRKQRVFCSSLADVFDNQVPPSWRTDLAQLINRTPNLDWLLLTKRIGNAGDMMATHMGWGTAPPPHVWLGATIVNQTEADRDIPKLLHTPAAIKFLSMEPLLGPVQFGTFLWGGKPDHVESVLDHLDWIIVGGESGRGARPMNPTWARQIRDQCLAAGTPFLFKQWGEWAPYLGQVHNEGDVMMMDSDQFVRTGHWMREIGKKRAGRALDGAYHDGFPK